MSRSLVAAGALALIVVGAAQAAKMNSRTLDPSEYLPKSTVKKMVVQAVENPIVARLLPPKQNAEIFRERTYDLLRLL